MGWGHYDTQLKHAQSTGQGTGAIGGIAKLLNIKRAFADAQRVLQIKDAMEGKREAAQMASQERIAGVGQDGSSGGKGVYMVDPYTGEIKQAGNIPVGSKIYKGVGDQETRLDYREQTKEQDRVFKAKQGLDAYLSDANQVNVALNKIEKMAKELGDFKRGIVGQTYAKVKTGVGAYAKDEKINRYLGVVAQELIPLARKVMEEKGPITEWDVQRVEKGLGDLTAPLSDKLFLINEMRSKIKEAIALKRRIASGKEGMEEGQEDPLGIR